MDNDILIKKAIELTNEKIEIKKQAISIMKDTSLSDEDKVKKLVEFLSTDNPDEALEDVGVFEQIKRLKQED